MAKKEKTPLPDEGSDNLITALSIAAAFVASVTLALGIGIAVQYTSTNAAIMPEETVSSQQVAQPAQGQAAQADTKGADSGDTSVSGYGPEDNEPTAEPVDEPGDSDESDEAEDTPQEDSVPQADTASTPSTQTPSSNPGASTNKTDPTQSSGNTPSNPSSGTNSGSTVTLPSISEANNSSPKDQSGERIYITPTGKRYHYDNNCNGGTYIESSLEEATRLGLTPCEKCVLQ